MFVLCKILRKNTKYIEISICFLLSNNNMLSVLDCKMALCDVVSLPKCEVRKRATTHTPKHDHAYQR